MSYMYLVVAYKPNSDDYCRGCHMASYDSEHHARRFEKEDELIDFISDLLSQPLDCGEDGFEYQIFEPFEFEETEEFDERIKEETKKKIEARQKFEKEQAEQKKRLESARQKKQELETLRKLKEKYPDEKD